MKGFLTYDTNNQQWTLYGYDSRCGKWEEEVLDFCSLLLQCGVLDELIPSLSILPNGNWAVNGEDQGTPAQGPQGPQGDPGDVTCDKINQHIEALNQKLTSSPWLDCDEPLDPICNE